METNNGKMSETELTAQINALGLADLEDACIAIGNHSRIQIDAHSIKTELKRSARLTRYQTAMFRMFFELRSAHKGNVA